MSMKARSYGTIMIFIQGEYYMPICNTTLRELLILDTVIQIPNKNIRCIQEIGRGNCGAIFMIWNLKGIPCQYIFHKY